MNTPTSAPFVAILACLASLAPAWAQTSVTPAQLEQRLAQDTRITLIDVRSTSLFERGHIPNAINIPATLVPAKQLPPIGTVIVYDSGLGIDEATPAAAALNRKRGIRAEVLSGGFAGWESTQGTTTRLSGLQPEELPFISYQDLHTAQSDQMILVDLRRPPALQRQSSSPQPATPPLTDLKQAFPKAAAVTQSPFNLPQQRQGANAVPPLLVLIDNGDGQEAQAVARRLMAGGVRRVTILAGGEEIIARGGEPGLQRVGSSIEAPRRQE